MIPKYFALIWGHHYFSSFEWLNSVEFEFAMPRCRFQIIFISCHLVDYTSFCSHRIFHLMPIGNQYVLAISYNWKTFKHSKLLLVQLLFFLFYHDSTMHWKIVPFKSIFNLKWWLCAMEMIIVFLHRYLSCECSCAGSLGPINLKYFNSTLISILISLEHFNSFQAFQSRFQIHFLSTDVTKQGKTYRGSGMS